MKITWRIITVVFLLFLLVAPAFNFSKKANAANATNDGNFYVGVTYGLDTVADAKRLIDNVSGYTNLFVVDSATISGASNSTALDEICDYAVKANMSVIVYFYMIYYNVTANIGSLYNASTWDAYGVAPWHVSWLNSSKERWGDKFLGVYLFDEPGGKQIDTGYWGGNNVTFSGSRVRTFENVSSYDDAANRYISSIRTNRGMQILSNTSYLNGINYTIPAFTSDYALYWFDYKAGYSAVFAELGGPNGLNYKMQQIALCRGAAQAQNNDWGAIITWANDNPPAPESGVALLQDMSLAYDAGAKYVIAFNYAVNGTGGLADEQFGAMKQFWTNVQASPRNMSEQKTGKVGFILPTNYGWGMRTTEDKIWGLWPADNISLPIWQNMNTLIEQYGSQLDIIYDDPQFNVTEMYDQTYLWNSTIPAITPSPLPSPTTNGTQTSTPHNITATPTPTIVNPSTSPTSTPPQTSDLLPPPRNYLPLIAGLMVPIGLTACIGFYLVRRSKRSFKPVFPAASVNTKLQGFGKGTLQLSDETLNFNPEQGRFGKHTETAKQIELIRVENLNVKGSQISLRSNGQTDTFDFNKKLTPHVYAGIKAAWDKQKRVLEKATAMPEQEKLKDAFTAVAHAVDPLFDILLHLHGEIDWKGIESCVIRCKESTSGTSVADPSAASLNLASLYSAVAQRKPDFVAGETRLILNLIYSQVAALDSENPSFEQFRPNYSDLKKAVVAYYALNDIILGEVVGDADLAAEKTKFISILSSLSSGAKPTGQDNFGPEALSNLANKEASSVAKTRNLFARQLLKTLNPNII